MDIWIVYTALHTLSVNILGFLNTSISISANENQTLGHVSMEERSCDNKFRKPVLRTDIR